jgi:hypothetical protein
MKKQIPPNIEKLRIRKGPMASDSSFGNNGAFQIPYASGMLYVIISDCAGWDHVSVSLSNRCPTWDEMHWIKNLFFNSEETVVQFHPKESQYVNRCKHCLHLWKKHGTDYELPPREMIG